jgi:hypothetical protein
MLFMTNATFHSEGAPVDGMTGIIDVDHQCEDGWHEFTSPQVPGLYVVIEAKDLKAAYYDISTVIEALIYADYATPVKVRPQKTFEQYHAGLPETHKGRHHYFVERIAA